MWKFEFGVSVLKFCVGVLKFDVGVVKFGVSDLTVSDLNSV